RDDGVEVAGVLLERLDVAHVQRQLIACHAHGEEPGGADIQYVRAEGCDLLVDPLLGTRYRCKHCDHGADTDDDPEHRQHRAEEVRVDRLKSDADDLAEKHWYTRRMAARLK